jgi:protein-disulfide isomerase
MTSTSAHNILNNIFTGILVLCAVTITVLILRREFAQTLRPQASKVENWKKLLGEGHWFGPNDAAVYIIAFFDYECPPCKRLELTLDAVLSKYNDKVALIRYHFPSKTHENAREAAIAAECAGKQGRFAVYHSLLFQNQNVLTNQPWSMLARLAGIPDVDAFEKCVQTHETAMAVERHVHIGKSLGAVGTPTLIINGDMVTGNLSATQLEDRIRYFLEANR